MTEQAQQKALSQPKQGLIENIVSFLRRNEFLIPGSLFVIFLAVALPGISWGAPSIWHPDEIVVRSMKALKGEWQFSESNFDYPDLPQYVMYWLGRVVLSLGHGDMEILIASRVLSAVLAGLTIVLVYAIARRISDNPYVAGLSALLLLCTSELAHNARFAHNDTYLIFFVTLTILFLILYEQSKHRGWLYASFLGVGMAASSKYNGISLVLVPIVLYIVSKRHVLFTRPLRTLETLSIGGALTFLGFAIGTPKALFWMTFYFKRMIPALLHTGSYLQQPDSVRGILGQYASLLDATGLPLFLLFCAAFLWGGYRLLRAYRSNADPINPRNRAIGILMLTILALDLPIMISYNFPTRFLLSLMPAFAILGALMIEDLYKWSTDSGRVPMRTAITAVLACFLLFSFLRNISVMLLFSNDARIPASKYVENLPGGASLEHTYYPPTIPNRHFSREHNYPIYFRKHADEELPISKRYVFNVGESGLNERETDYLVVDSFTTDKFQSPYTCMDMQIECNFFRQLETGRSDHYQLVAEFSYTLPPYLPRMNITFVNPAIRIYERIR